MSTPRREPASVARIGTAVEHVDVVVHRPAGSDSSPDAGLDAGLGPGSGLGVLLAHGAGGDLGDQVLVALADVVVSAGHVAVRTNLGYRQQRSSGPPPRAEASVADLAATLVAVASRLPGRRWVLGGKSYGGRVATLVAASGLPDGERPVALLCVSYPLHPPGRPDRLRVDHFPDVAVPLLVLQGTSDPFGGPDELDPHLASLAGTATLVAVDGGDHGLHVPRTRSADGATHNAPGVVAGHADQVGAWLAEVAPG